VSERRQQGSLGEGVVVGILWMGAWRWTARLLGFVNTVVIARFLVPGDVGLVATALLVVVFFDSLVDLGTDKYLIRLPDPDRDDYDTAWTLRLAVLAVASLVIVLAAPLAARFFDDARLAAVLQVLAVANFLRGFTNIGLTIFRRNMQFGRIAMIGLAQRSVGVTATVILAVLLANYWAIVIGEVIMRVAEVALSYLAQPYRPRFGITRFGRQWAFCRWIVIRTVARFAQGRGDQFVIARFFGIEAMGLFSMATRLAELPTRHLAAPISMPVYAGLARKQGDHARFVGGIVQVTGATAAVVLPAATIVAALGEPLVIALFGAKWAEAVPLVAPVVFAMAAAVVAESADTALTLVGRVGVMAAIEWASAVLVLGAMLAAAQFLTLEQVAYVRLALVLALLLVGYAYVVAALRVTWRQLAGSVVRPSLSSVAAWAAIKLLSGLGYGPWPTIILGGLVGGVTYLGSAWASWQAAGRPDAGEALVLQKLVTLSARIRRRGG
jgi:PST family polysaccharide transporter